MSICKMREKGGGVQLRYGIHKIRNILCSARGQDHGSLPDQHASQEALLFLQVRIVAAANTAKPRLLEAAQSFG